MSHKGGQALPAVEWSPAHVTTAIPGQPSQHGIPSGIHSVRACLSRRHTFVRAIRIPNVGSKEADKLLRLQAPQAFPVPADQLVHAFRLTSNVTAEGRLAVVVATRADIVRSLHESLRTMGAKPVEVIGAAFGSMLLARSMGLNDVAIVEESQEGWSIDIVADGELRHSRVIPLETEKAALESEICRTFGMAGIPCGTTLAAGGLKLDFADVSTDRSTLEFLSLPDAGNLGIAFELPEVVAARERRLVGNRARLAVLLWVSAAVMGFWIASGRIERAVEVQKYQSQWESGTSKLKAERDAAQLKLTNIIKVTEVLDRAFKPAQRASEVATLVNSLAPQGVWLTGMTFERGKAVTVRGAATSSNAVAAFQDALSNNERFRDVTVVFSNEATIEDTKVTQFSLSIHAIGNLPIIDPKSKSKVGKK